MPIRARSPPDTWVWPSPTIVPRPSGRESSQSPSRACRRADSTRASLAPGRANRMFSASVEEKR